MRVLLVNDTRTVSLLTAVVLHRVFTSQGHSVEAFFGVTTTRSALRFWRDVAPTIDLAEVDQIHLCSMTFSDAETELCVAQINAWKKWRSGVVIYTHRWPDGYVRSRFQVMISPFEILDSYSAHLGSEERELLRYSLIEARQSDVSTVGISEIQFSEFLAYKVWNKDNPSTYYWCLVNDLKATLRDLKDEFAQQPSLISSMHEANTTLQDYGRGFYYFDLSLEARPHYEKTIEGRMRLPLPGAPFDDRVLGFGSVVEDDGYPRIFIKRPWGTRTLPSVQWLLEQYSAECELPQHDVWLGQQDSKNLDFRKAGLQRDELPRIKAGMRRFAEIAHQVSFGERSPDPTLARILHEAASRALAAIDIKLSFAGRSLRFDPDKTRMRIDEGNRSGEERHTVILHLDAESPEAASFLYANAGYNLAKLEQLLEGVLIGLGTHTSIWLGALRLPERLRINLCVNNANSELKKLLQDEKEVETLSLPDAIAIDLIKRKSAIFRLLSETASTRDLKLVIFRQSEVIGPSVQYALLVEELAGQVAEGRSSFLALDLFAGSGLVARSLLSKSANIHVFCVDSAISGRDVGLQDEDRVTWLRCSAADVVGNRALIDRSFDLITMDPPHSALLDLLHDEVAQGRSFLESVAERTPLLVVYQGHVSQAGRASELVRAIVPYLPKVALWTVGSETIIVAGRTKLTCRDRSVSFEDVMEIAKGRIKMRADRYQWVVNFDIREADQP